MTRLRALAPGKTNLGLYLGPTRPDGYHELVSLIEPLSLADELTLEPRPGAEALGGAAPGFAGETCALAADEVVCAGVEGPNLAARALADYRAASGWDGPPQRLTIAKRVPVAAGMGGGSGDAAAALRLVAHAAGRPGDPLIARLAPALGADVPSQVEPAPVLVHGVGEQVERVAAPPPHALVVVPAGVPLSTPDVFREADRLGIGRSAQELLELRERLREGLLPELLVNDLEPAARSLCPAIEPALAALRAAGAEHAFVSGSGPTTIGLWWGGEDARSAALAAAEALRGRFPQTVATAPVGPGFAAVGAVRENGAPHEQ